MADSFRKKLGEYLGREQDATRLKTALVKVARQYILDCERYDQSISKMTDNGGWAVLATPEQQADAKHYAETRLKKAWEDVASNGYDETYFNIALSAEAELVGNMSWEAYQSMHRPDLE